MVLGRKFRIWFISFIVVLFIFLFYRMFSSIGIIRISKTDYQMEQQDANRISSDSNAGRIGQAKLEYVERARFETVDPKTRKLKRVIGFEKVLHKSGNEWTMDKPYMSVFQENLRCDITANTGTVELENVERADPSPKQAVLQGNVVVHIIPKGKANSSDSFIYLNEVTFDSDRSMLWSNNDVNFVSADADLAGRGLEIVYNNVTNKLEYLKINNIDFLNIKNLPKTAGDEKKTAPQSPQATQPSQTQQSSKTSGASAEVKAAEPVIAAKSSEPCAVPQKPTAKKEESYQCLFRENVTVEYKEEVVLADEVAVTNLLWSENQQEQQAEPASQPQPQAQSTSQAVSQPPSASKSQPDSPNTAPAEIQIKAEEVKPPPEWKQRPVIAKVRCKGPMIVKPVSSTIFGDFKPAAFKGFYQLENSILSWLGQRNVLVARKVDYDMAAKTASAAGHVELVFYPQTETSKGRGKLPFIISAKQGAQFVVPEKTATFTGNVKGAFVKQTDFYDEENTFYGNKLIANLAEKRGSQDIMASSDISHITILGPNVRLESIRTIEKTKLSHVRLKSERIDYDRAAQNIIATGKGKIEYSNTTKSSVSTSSQRMLDKPCYSLVEGFTRLVWDTNTMHVKATSEKTAGVHIGYLPVLETGYGRKTTIDTRQVDIDYFEPIKGKAQLKQLNATGGIVYYEQGRYEFAGKELIYNAAEDFMTISGSSEMPCMLNGVFAEGIEYNLKTGAASAVLSGGVGIMPVRE